MGVIWVIEKPDKGTDSLASYLQGDFPVRLFGSFDSFMMLQKIKQQVLPDAVLVDTVGIDYELKWMDNVIACYLPHAKRIYVFDEGEELPFSSGSTIAITRNGDPLLLTNQIKGLVGAKEKPSNIYSYKSLFLDFEKMILQMLPSHDVVYLTPKEARLMKFFLENPGQCFAREEIHRAVWKNTRVAPRTIDSQISRLRRHLAATDVEIESVYGGGYVLK